MAFPDRTFKGKVSKIYETVDPNTHRVTIRSEITDPKDELRPGMLANFVIRVRGPVEATAVPANGVVREPDGTMAAWVTTDRTTLQSASSRRACELTARFRFSMVCSVENWWSATVRYS